MPEAGRSTSVAGRPAGLRPAVFFDRDGTLVRDEAGYLHRVEDLRWFPAAREAVGALNRAGLATIVVTNQSGVARGLYGEAEVEAFHAAMQADLAEADARIDAFYYAPTHPEGAVARYAVEHEDRKPGAGMFRRAVAERELDPARSFMVGDTAADLVPARALGLTTLLVLTGHGRHHAATAPADYVVADVAEAARVILESVSSRR